MVIHVKDVETDDLVRRLAKGRGIGITEAIKEAVREALETDSAHSARSDIHTLEERLKPLFNRLDRLPRAGMRTDKAFFDEVWSEGGD